MPKDQVAFTSINIRKNAPVSPYSFDESISRMCPISQYVVDIAQEMRLFVKLLLDPYCVFLAKSRRFHALYPLFLIFHYPDNKHILRQNI